MTSVGVTIIFLVILSVFAILDIVMLVTLSLPGDERNQIIVWKASTFTLLTTVGGNVLDVIGNLVRA